jgi:predicted ester cyclase
MTVVQANEAVVRRFYEELWNEHRPILAEEIIADAIRFRGSLGTTLTGREEFKRYVEMVLTAFPDWDNKIDEMLATGDRVVTRMTWSGTHLGRLGNVEPTRARVQYCGAGFFRLSDGVIEEAWIVGDTQELWRALYVARDGDLRPLVPGGRLQATV